MNTRDLANEWALLQNQFDSYEKYSLVIKLASTGLLAAAYFTDHISVFVLLLLLTLWLQDGIWKTFQARIETRLMQLERSLANEVEQSLTVPAAYQFNTQYQQHRPSTAGLVLEYCAQALRPTVAFPHVPLLLMAALALLL